MLSILWLPVILLAVARARIARRQASPNELRLWWGVEPLVNYRYLSEALRAAGHVSTTVVTHDYAIYRSQRFDAYLPELARESFLPGVVARRSTAYIAFCELLRNYDVAHFSFRGGALSLTPLAALEPHLLKWAGVRTVVMAYGLDFWRYSWIHEALVRHAMQISYPDAGRDESAVDSCVKRWSRHADILLSGFMVEGASRWDVIVPNFLVLPERDADLPVKRGSANGKDGPVVILHAPNHRGIKGTEFIVSAVEQLRRRGYDIDLRLLESVPNHEVLALMEEADICIEHCIGSGFGLFTIESMRAGAAVIGNLEDDARVGVHRYFGWLGECPVVSCRLDELESTMERLIVNPALRQQLGEIGAEYAARYHSPTTARFLFSAIYRKLCGSEVDLMRLFHPITSDYLKGTAKLAPPLQRSRLPG